MGTTAAGAGRPRLCSPTRSAGPWCRSTSISTSARSGSSACTASGARRPDPTSQACSGREETAMHRHAADVVSLVFGLIFAGFTLLWAAVGSGLVDQDDGWWLGPIVLVAAGVVGVATALRKPAREGLSDN